MDVPLPHRSGFFARLEPRRVRPATRHTAPLSRPGAGAVPDVAIPHARSAAGADNIYRGPGDAPAGLTVSDGGGPKLGIALMSVIFWGNAWTNPATSPSTGQLLGAIDALLNPLYPLYLTGLKQYGLIAGAGITGQSLIVTSPEPPNPFSPDDVGNKIWDLIDDGHYPDPGDAQFPNLYIVFMPPGVNPTNNILCGEHSVASDYDFPSGTESVPFAWVRFGTLDQMSRCFSHELVEAMTDPYGDGIQVDPRNGTNWNEIGDVCNSAAYVNGVWATSYFSAKDGACIIPTPPPPPPPPLSPGDYRIDCVSLWQHNGHPFIGIVGGSKPDGSRWEFTEPVVIGLIRDGTCTFYTEEAGRRADIVIDRSDTGWDYLKTVADNFVPNNLLSLPHCAD